MLIPSRMAVRRRRVFVVVYALLITCGMAWPLLTPWLHDQHEGYCYATRLITLAEGLSSQHAHPRWSPELAAGHGYPLLNFYPPGFSYLALAFLPLGAVTAVKVTVVLATFAGILLLYGLGRHVGGFAGGMVACTVGPLATYTTCNLYTRGDFAEYTAFFAAAGVAWALLYALKARMRPGPLLLFAAAFGAFVPLHTISSLVYTTIFVLIAAVMAARHRFSAARWLRLAGEFALGLALSAWYWLPALLEKRYVSTDRMLDGAYFIELHFTRSPNFFLAVSRSQPVLGLVITACFVFSLAAALKLRRKRVWLSLCGFIVLGCIMLNFPVSEPFWQHVPLVRYIQFPWRLNGPAVLFACAGMAAAVRVFRPWMRRRVLPAGAALFAVLWLLALAVSLQKLVWIQPCPGDLEPGVNHWVTTSGRDEYLPKGVDRAPIEFSAPLLTPQVVVESSSVSGAVIEAVVRCDSAQRVVIRQWAYPGWEVHVDDNPVAWRADDLGRLCLDVSPGRHEIRAEMRRTGIQKSAEWLSGLSAMLAGLGAIRLLRRSKRELEHGL